jgi:uncharacterized Fe-S cluster protein YjdI
MARHLQVYTHDALVVTFDPARCIHAATCVRLLPAVFDAKARPWIRPDAADATAILDVVRRCPSGALKASMEGAAVDVDGDEVALQRTDARLSTNRDRCRALGCRAPAVTHCE